MCEAVQADGATLLVQVHLLLWKEMGDTAAGTQPGTHTHTQHNQDARVIKVTLLRGLVTGKTAAHPMRYISGRKCACLLQLSKILTEV